MPAAEGNGTIVPTRSLYILGIVHIRAIRLASIAAVCLLGAGLLAGVGTAAIRSVEIEIGDLEGPAFTAKNVRIELAGPDLAQVRLTIGDLAALDQRFQDVAISCTAFRYENDVIECGDGRVERPVGLPVSFRYDIASGAARIVASPGGAARWTVEATGGAPRRIVASGAAIPAALLHRIAPDLPVKISAGTADGTLNAVIPATGDIRVDGAMTLRGGAFADESGLHAGENVGARLTLHAEGPAAGPWQWRAETDWSEGEVFWSPVYSKAGFKLAAEGRADARTVEVARAKLTIAGVGEIRAKGTVDVRSGDVLDAMVETDALAVEPLYARFLEPALAQTALGDLRTEGRVQASARWQNGRTTQMALELDDVSAEDRRGRFALFGVYASIPWQAGARTEGRIGMSGAEVQRLPFGAVGTFLDIRPDEVFVGDFAIPVLSGLFSLNDLHLRRTAEGIAWRVHGALSPVPLAELLAHFGLPAMQGTLSGEIPQMRYERSTLTVDGALTLHVFDGTVKVTDLLVDSPLGLAPRLTADLEARNLDLALVTRAYSFGSITGRVDAGVKDLVLSNWRPVRFDARIESSPGDYPRRISQTAVNNISALGGVGAAVAVQRSVLHLFDSFGYSKLGISCRLQDGVCRMGGIADAPQGYVLVEGGGVPAIRVLGYNRDVGWDELLTRLKRVIDSNVTPTIQ